jgi:hypothetical protein
MWNPLVGSHQLWADDYSFGVDGNDHDGNDDDNDDGNDGNDDCVSDGDHCTRSTQTSRLAMSMLASKLPQT